MRVSATCRFCQHQLGRSSLPRRWLLSGLLVATAVGIGQGAGSMHAMAQEGGAFGSGMRDTILAPLIDRESPVQVSVSAGHLDLSKGHPIFPADSAAPTDTLPQASFSVQAFSFLPEWGVSLEARNLKGPAGAIPPERIWARTSATRDSFLPLAAQVPVVTTTTRAPARDSEVEVMIRPQWQDPPGAYTGQLIMKPYVPDYSQAGFQFTGGERPLGAPQQVTVTFSIAETISLSVATVQISFDISEGPRDEPYACEPTVEFTMSTNASTWRIVYEISELVSDNNAGITLSPDRVYFAMPSAAPGMIPSVEDSIDPDDRTILAGIGPREDLNGKVQFYIQIRPEDVAGTYTGTISLEGLLGL